jgi:CHAT domain-containing protein/tetratricopeptide (TPR) repeat protein
MLLAVAVPAALRAADDFSYSAAFDSAVKAFKADKLVESEQQFQAALRLARDDSERAACLERLPAVYVRMGRHDLAIECGLRYQRWLKERDPKQWREWSVEVGRWYVTLGHTVAAETQLTQALADGSDPGLPDARRLEALLALARVAELRGNAAQTQRYWKEVETTAARRLLDGPEDQRERGELMWHLAESLRYQQRGDEAIKKYNELLPVLRKLDDTAGQRNVLRRLAALHAGRGEAEKAERCLQDAHALPDDDKRPSRHARADIAAEMTDLLRRQPGRAEDAVRWRDRAAVAYRDLLTDHAPGPAAAGSHLAAFWKLQTLYQAWDRYTDALGALDEWTEPVGGPLMLSRARAEKGSISLYLEDFRKAHALLRDAVTELERRPVVNVLELPRAYNNLAFATQVVSGLNDEAGLASVEKMGEKCLALYREHQLADDVVLVEMYNLLGTNAAARGQYAQAVQRFRTGIAKAEKVGSKADPQRSNLLLNLALLYKAQSQPAEALATCRQALDVYRRFAEPDALGFAYFEAALVNLHLAARQLDEAYQRVPELLRLCAKHERSDGPLVVTARYCEAVHQFEAGRFDEAAKSCQEVRRLQEKAGQTLFLPRTLNRLGLVEEALGHDAEARRHYEQARTMQDKSGGGSPATHFLTLWRLAQIERRRGSDGYAESRRLVDEAVRIVERARVQTFADAQQRANYFAVFGPAFDQMVAWAVEDGDGEAALVAATRGRSRTLLDQLLAASVDPRTGVPGAEGDKLRAREDELRRRLAALRIRAQFIPVDAAGPAADLLKEYDRAREEYAGVWREMFNASPAFRALSVEETSAPAIAAACARLRQRNAAMLVYHFGRDQSHVLLVGDKGVHAYPLLVSEELAARVAAPKPLDAPGSGETPVVRGLRGFKLEPPPPAPPPAPAAAPAGKMVPLRLATAEALVQSYRRDAVQPSFRADRGFVLEPVAPGKPVPLQRREVIGDVLLPTELRARLQAMKPDQVVVVPDGPLHGFPLEAILLSGGDKPRYVLDELPPLVYVPSAAILTRAIAPPASGLPTLLTVANPAYRRGVSRPASNVDESQRRNIEQLRVLSSRLPDLPGTEKESEAIRRHFKDVASLSGGRATRQAVIDNIAGKRVVHVAAHGFATEDFGNLFGALALSPTADDDGFLSLHEVYALPLKDCELAVLSACVTNVGPQRPLEAGVTLSNAFLTAGARRVVASHWSVDDEATAVLMETFFQEISTAAAKGERVSYSHALQRAQRAVRNKPEWAAPHYWAPFVLMGQPD